MLVYGWIENHMFDFLNVLFYIKNDIVENNLVIKIFILPKYSFHNEHQSRFSGFSCRAWKTSSFAGVAIE